MVLVVVQQECVCPIEPFDGLLEVEGVGQGRAGRVTGTTPRPHTHQGRPRHSIKRYVVQEDRILAWLGGAFEGVKDRGEVGKETCPTTLSLPRLTLCPLCVLLVQSWQRRASARVSLGKVRAALLDLHHALALHQGPPPRDLQVRQQDESTLPLS